jgi:hypothetical protein
LFAGYYNDVLPRSKYLPAPIAFGDDVSILKTAGSAMLRQNHLVVIQNGLDEDFYWL